MNQQLHIVIAEDDEDDRFIIEESFRRNSQFTTIHLVKNGRELLDYLHAPEKPKPDVILTDINMPIMDGIQALKAICKDKELNDIPTFVYSTTVNPVYQMKCRELGTKGYLTKPTALEDFNKIPEQIISIMEDVSTS
ncbi:MAG: response regulator [Flavobacterium sp.]|nr:MAG: response regulator [Flavobacterium sp.]